LAYYVERTKLTGMSRGSGPARKPARRNDPGVLIMTSLASGAKHGYALARDIERFAGVTLGPGTLYGAITTLEENGLIEPTGQEERRRPYQLTAAGQAELTAAVRSLGAIAAEGARRLGIASQVRNLGWAQ
jgi:DNA-binding PadR family transcriptional regulator